MMPPSRNRPPVRAGGAGGIGNNQHSQYTTQTAATAIVQAYGLKPCGKGSWQGNCPTCGYADAFSLTMNSGKLLWHCHACGDREGVQDCLQGLGLLGSKRNPLAFVQRPLFVQKARKEPDPGKLDYARTLWAEAVPMADTVAAVYLQGRGLVCPYPAALRFAPACNHTPTGQRHPAMIAAVSRWPSAELVAVHRTYIKPDGSGKINHPQARMILPDCSGGAVQLAPAGTTVAIAEGIETALSVQTATGLPTWACLSTSGMRAVLLPDTVREVVICADHDPPGLKAANAAAERLTRQGKRVKIATPPQADTDFNDMLKGAGHE